MAGPLPNFHVANAFPPILLNYYLLKSIFHLYYPRPSQGAPWGCSSPAITWLCALMSPALKPDLLLPQHGGTQPLFPWFPCLGNIESCLFLPAQSLTVNNFIYQLEPAESRDTQCLTCRILVQFGNP